MKSSNATSGEEGGKNLYPRCSFKLDVDKHVCTRVITIEELRHKEERWLFSMLGFAFFFFILWLVFSFDAKSIVLLLLALALTLIGDMGGVYYSHKIEKLKKVDVTSIKS